MSHYGNISHETLAAVVDLDRRLGDKDYNARGINGRGHLVIELHLQKWSGERGWRLFLRCLRLLWRGFHDGLRAQWVLRDDGKGEQQ